MEQSILKSTKEILSVSQDDDSFDLSIITHINSAFSTLHQLGVGPEEGFAIEDDVAEWENFLADPVQLNQAKTCVYLRVRLLFDPPTTSFLLAAMQKQLEECDWRINTVREDNDWVDPDPELTRPGGRL